MLLPLQNLGALPSGRRNHSLRPEPTESVSRGDRAEPTGAQERWTGSPRARWLWRGRGLLGGGRGLPGGREGAPPTPPAGPVPPGHAERSSGDTAPLSSSSHTWVHAQDLPQKDVREVTSGTSDSSLSKAPLRLKNRCNLKVYGAMLSLNWTKNKTKNSKKKQFKNFLLIQNVLEPWERPEAELETGGARSAAAPDESRVPRAALRWRPARPPRAPCPAGSFPERAAKPLGLSQGTGEARGAPPAGAGSPRPGPLAWAGPRQCTQ